MSEPRPLDVIEAHVSIDVFAQLVGLSKKTIQNRLAAKDPELLKFKPTIVLGHPRFPVSAIREAFERGRQKATGVRGPIRAIHAKGA